MTELLGVPLHPAVSHFPVAAAAFAALALLAAATRPPRDRGPWHAGAALLLGAALVSGALSVLSGRAWADSLGLLPGAAWIPPASARGGILRQHVLLATGGLLLAALAALSLALRRAPRAAATVLALLSAALLLAAGHAGGRMAHGDARDPGAGGAGASPVSASGRP